MHFILILSISFLSNFDFCTSPSRANLLSNQPNVKTDFLLVQQKKAKKRIRWKQVFRPIKIFKKKLKFWLLIFGVISLGLGTFFFVADRLGGLDGLFFKILFGILATSTLLMLLCVLAIPIILIIRIIKEIKWSKRFSNC